MTRIDSFTRDGLVFDVLDEGPIDGDVVVLLHGFPERASCWRDVVPLLHAWGLRTLAPDQRGYSPGARPRGRRAYRIAELAADVAALVEQVEAPVHLAGHDWGSTVGWAVAAGHPDLVRTWTAFSVPHPLAFSRALLGRQGLRSWYMAAFNVPWLPESRPSIRLFEQLALRGGWDEVDVARFRQEIVEYGALPGALAWYRAMPWAPFEQIGRVRVPTTMVSSDEDAAIDRRGIELTEQFCTGPYRLIELSGVSHWIPTKAPEAAAAAILDRIGT